jgi:hypothetical protein
LTGGAIAAIIFCSIMGLALITAIVCHCIKKQQAKRSRAYDEHAMGLINN